MVEFIESLKKFSNLPLEVQLTIDNEKVAQAIEIINKKYDVNLYPAIILLSTNDLTDKEIPQYLKREFGVNDLKANLITNEFEQNIVAPLTLRLLLLDTSIDKPLSLQDEKKIIINIFQNNLVQEIDENSLITESINQRIFYILSRDISFQKELENALYNNQEKLTHKEFILQEKPSAPTISSWIKDFVRQNGSDLFDNLTLSKFISNSLNTKKLNESEKQNVKRVLQLYRNIKFFPDSMPSDDGRGWEIIPVPSDEEELLKARTVRISKEENTPPTSLQGEIMEEKPSQAHFTAHQNGTRFKKAEENTPPTPLRRGNMSPAEQPVKKMVDSILSPKSPLGRGEGEGLTPKPPLGGGIKAEENLPPTPLRPAERGKKGNYQWNFDEQEKLINKEEKEEGEISPDERVAMNYQNVKNLDNDQIPTTSDLSLDSQVGVNTFNKDEVVVEKEENKQDEELENNLPPTPLQRGNSYELETLKKLAQQYPVGSLQRKAIEEELDKLINART